MPDCDCEDECACSDWQECDGFAGNVSYLWAWGAASSADSMDEHPGCAKNGHQRCCDGDAAEFTWARCEGDSD